MLWQILHLHQHTFPEAYAAEKAVVNATDNGLNKKALKFLGNTKGNVVIKLAVINALGFGNKDYVKTFETYLLEKRKGLEASVFDALREPLTAVAEESDQTKLLTANDLACWAYLQVMGDYFNPSVGSRASMLAYLRDEKSMAHSLIFTLIACQKAFEHNWCSVYEMGQKYIVDTEYESNQLNEEAINIIMEYLLLYKDSC